MKYASTKRTKRDECNICRTVADLTWDHVPPQGSIEITPIEIHRLYAQVLPEAKFKKPLIMQNGNKYRTICKACNSLLGGHYDPAINKIMQVSFCKSRVSSSRSAAAVVVLAFGT
jgi:hypothetical protein